jgi:hypothetical protein
MTRNVQFCAIDYFQLQLHIRDFSRKRAAMAFFFAVRLLKKNLQVHQASFVINDCG